MKGVIIKSTGSWYQVRTAGGEQYACRLPGKLRLAGSKSTNPLAVGDRVEFALEEDQQTGLIRKIAERKNHIVRKSVNLSKQTQVIATNLDQAVLVATLAHPPTLPRFIDRFLVTAEAYDVPAALVFNKIDLYDAQQKAELEYYQTAYREAGYPVLFTSAVSGEGLMELRSLLEDKVSLLSGHSGVGKSSLINALQPGLELRTAAISEAHDQGLHTTTFAEMYPLDFGGYIVDTPGIKGFGLVDMDKYELGDYFPEILRLKDQCKFSDCLHLEEPGCAVRAALEANRMAPTRYESYLNFVRGTDDDETYRKDEYAE